MTVIKNYSEMYKVEKSDLLEKGVTGSVSSYSGLVDEEKGGVIAYLHESISESFTCFLAWEHPTMNSHITGTDHEDYEGWVSLGWELCTTTMGENLSLNKTSLDAVEKIVIDERVLAYAVGKNHAEALKPLITSWYEAHCN